ncbi:RYamide neuropeptides-like [Amyelois transitella]|uniref:RYamide neuropeptides-like n=1 Tax=Amyelois transitella TaxID=680683 RepID=UPI0029902617|nr:RYamide neuropeptides-like [Amyelois transitella]
MWIYVCAFLVISAAFTDAVHAEKRAEISPVPFVLSTRYGRSPPRVMMPRNDRFFLGSRYGKRSEVSVGSSLPPQGTPSMLCEYTGVYSLFRCKIPTRGTYEARASEESPASEE